MSGPGEANVGRGYDHEPLRRVFLADQSAGAVETVSELLALAAGGAPVVPLAALSPWVLRTIRAAKRAPCPHSPVEGSDVVVVPSCMPRWLCRPCGEVAARRWAGSLDALRCDVCREAPESALLPFAFTRSTVLVSGQCCAGCLPVVVGVGE